MKTITANVFLLVTAPALAAKPSQPLPSVKSLATVGEIDAEATEASTTLTVRLDQKPDWGKPRDLQDHGTFLQLILPSVIVPEPGKFFEGDGPYIKKIAVFQLTPSDAGVRIFVDGNAARVKAATSLELLDRRVVLNIDHARIPPAATQSVADVPHANPSSGASGDDAESAAQAAANRAQSPQGMAASVAPFSPEAPRAFVGPPTPSVIEAKAATATADTVIAKTTVRNDPKPSDLLKNDKGGLRTSDGFDLRSKMIQASLFLAGMIALMLLALGLKPWLRRRAAKASGVEDQPLTIKTLATLPLAARQKVSVIQIGDERILIGVTTENVTFLTALGKSVVSPSQPIRTAATFSKLLAGGVTAGEVELRPRPRISGERPAAPDGPAMEPSAGIHAQPIVSPESARPARAAPQDVAAKKARAADPTPEAAPKAVVRSRPSPSKINIAVGDDGVKDLSKPVGPASVKKIPGTRPSAPASEGGQQAIDDVTKMIREKLRSLRSIS